MQDLDRSIIHRASAGDTDAFEKIYRLYVNFVYNIAFRVCGNAQDADEIAQDVFLKIYRKLCKFRLESSLKTWIYRIAVNTAINYSKRSTRSDSKNVEYKEELLTKGLGNTGSPDVDKEHNEHIVNRLLDILSPEQRACITLRHIEQLSYGEISNLLGVNINTVRTRLKRAREMLMHRRKEVITDEV